MIGPGTGIAPFRGFVQERLAVAKGGKPVGPTMLFFGCQNEAKHFMYRDELEQAKNQGVLSHLYTAYSRDQVGSMPALRFCRVLAQGSFWIFRGLVGMRACSLGMLRTG